MSRKKTVKAYWEMTTEELAEATKEFDEEFVADKAKPLTPQMARRWDRAKARPARREDGKGERVIAVRLNGQLLERCTALAKKKGISRDVLIARSLHALLAAESGHA